MKANINYLVIFLLNVSRIFVVRIKVIVRHLIKYLILNVVVIRVYPENFVVGIRMI
jgi:hypothetical protein